LSINHRLRVSASDCNISRSIQVSSALRRFARRVLIAVQRRVVRASRRHCLVFQEFVVERAAVLAMWARTRHLLL
jgi:hypothetical protein